MMTARKVFFLVYSLCFVIVLWHFYQEWFYLNYNSDSIVETITEVGLSNLIYLGILGNIPLAILTFVGLVKESKFIYKVSVITLIYDVIYLVVGVAILILESGGWWVIILPYYLPPMLVITSLTLGLFTQGRQGLFKASPLTLVAFFIFSFSATIFFAQEFLQWQLFKVCFSYCP